MRLNQAGVCTDLHVLAGAPHGVGMFIGTALAKQWEAIVMSWLDRRFANA
jgi:hypothetical protein